MNRLLNFLFVCLMQVSLAVASTHDLRVEVTPNGAGSLNISGGTYESGSSVYLNTYSNNGYVFKGWYNGETLLSSSASFNYKMPAKNVVVQARYEFDPKVPGNPAMPDTTTCYSFTAIVSPYGAGSLSNQKGKYAVGAKVSLHTYGNTGYKFIGWQNEDGTNISTSSSFNYTMPNHDVKLTALYSFDPSVPANPDSMATRYTVAVASKPMGGGSFNSTNVSTEEGNNVHLYAYTNTGYEFLRWENEQGETISTAQDFYFVMPHGNTKIYGVFDFNPAPPSNPSKNYWNKELGEVIVDDFTQGNLENAVSSVINGSDRGAVAMITVSGKMNNNDFGVVNNYSNCTLLNLSRITGINEIPSYAFDYTNLESVYLPATIEKIGYRAFYDCKQLSSLTVYAMAPPSLENDVFKGVQDGLVVYVPASAISQYQDAKGWKDFTILPIQEDIRSVSVSLPASVSAADYAQMWLELTNTKSGQRMHYVMTDRTTYTFANIIRNTSWNVVLRNQRGDVFGKIDNIDVKDEDVSVVFSSLARPQNVVLTIKTPDNTDVTSKAQITWLDSDGNYLSQSTSLSGLHSGSVVSYKVTLSQELAMQYTMPSQKKYVVSEDNNQVMITLEPIKQVTLSGCVKDLATKTALIGATVAVSQTFGGKYSKTMNAKTDAKGFYSLAVGNVPTSLAISASDYISQTIVCDSLMNGSDDISIPDVSLKGISGAVVSVGLNYTKCPTGNGEESVVQEWYADYNNITYSIYNQTKQKAISQFNVQYPQIVLLEEVDEGDILVMTATSKNNSFMPVTATAKVDGEQRANVLFNIIELGKLQATFTKNTNASVVGSLYDAKGKLLKSYDFSNASLTINDLVDGSYTLVTMGGSKLFNSIYDLSQLSQTGLILGTDYIQTSIEINSGKLTAVNIEEVPAFDESKLYYTGDNTSFTVNKSSVVAGNYLTLTGHLDFKSAYAEKVSNVNLIVDLPESCQFVENSVMVGNSTSSYTLQNNRIMIPMVRYTDRVRFCIIPTLGGEYAPSALAQFDIDGETITQPIGSANYTAKDLSISVPSVVAKTTIPVSGTAIGASIIEVYDGDVLIGQTKSLANGLWTTICELNEAYNLSTHSVYAKVFTKNGLSLVSETKVTTFDMNAIKVSKVTMYHYNPEMNKTFESIFDFQNPSMKPNTWTVYYPNKKFTYSVEFTNNSPKSVYNVILYVHTAAGEKKPLRAKYDVNKDLWIAECDFGNKNDKNYPVNVSISYDVNSQFDQNSIVSLFDNSTHIKSGNDVTVYNVDNSSLSLNSDGVNIEYGFSYDSITIDEIPKEAQVDTLLNEYTIYTICNYTKSTLSLYLPKKTIEILKSTLDKTSLEFLSWAEKACKKEILYLCFSIAEEAPAQTRQIAKALSLGTVVGYSFYAVMTGRRFYSMNQDAQNHFNQLQDLWNRVDRLDCMDDEYKDQIHDRIDKLFSQYFDIKLTSTLLQSNRSSMVNPSPLYAINYAGGWLNFAAEVGFITRRRQISNFIAGFENSCPPPPGGEPNGDEPSGSPNDNVQIDPSGFVYEGVFSNRLEGVTATCYYKEEIEDMYGDLHENIVKWDAKEYAQENPLFTDENGYYRWDVPQGLWQVKFEKEGYETAYSDWLPVPPPQLDVNIAMKQNVLPNVKEARAYEDAVEVVFDKYMMPEFLNTDNIIVMSGDKQVEGSIKLLDEEVKCEGETETFASKLRFNAKTPFEGSEVTLMINNRVKSYAGIRMQDDYSQSFAIEQEVRKIVCDSATVVGYGSADVISVSALPASASAGKTLRVHNSSTMILGTDVSSIELDENGKAEIPVIGELPGTAALTFTIHGYDLSATSIISVEQIKYEKTSAPTSNIATGATVNKGTQIELSCKTEGATIYYTLDGSCPCDENGTRLIYDGTPIVINDNVTIKAMAVAPNMNESDVVEFIYAIDPTGIDNVTIDEQVEIYPLPVREILNVTAGGKMIKHIKITSVNGVVVTSSSKSATKMTLNVGMIPAGVYIINVTTESGFFSRKIQKL